MRTAVTQALKRCGEFSPHLTMSATLFSRGMKETHMSETTYVAFAYVLRDDGQTVIGDCRECPTAADALIEAKRLWHEPPTVMAKVIKHVLAFDGYKTVQELSQIGRAIDKAHPPCR